MDIDSIYGTSEARHQDLDDIAGGTDRTNTIKPTKKINRVDGYNGKNKTYSNETKAAAVELCRRLRGNCAEAGRQLGIPFSTLYSWCNYD